MLDESLCILISQYWLYVHEKKNYINNGILIWKTKKIIFYLSILKYYTDIYQAACLSISFIRFNNVV